MRIYVMSACITVAILFSYIMFKEDVFHLKQLPIDDEQQGLNEQIIINFSHVVAENTPKGLAAAKFAELVEEKSGGQIIVEVHPNGVLYNDESELAALQDGKIQMIAPTISKMTTDIPNWQVLDLPFLFANEEQALNVLNGPLSKSLLNELQVINVEGLSFWYSGFKQMATQQQPILEVEDFNNISVRTMESEVLQQQFHLLGANPIVTTFNDLYARLLNKEVIAQENTISNLYSKDFYSIQQEITLSNHGIMAYAVMMDENFWRGLTPAQQQIIKNALAEMQGWQQQQAIMMNNNDLQQLLQNKDVSIYELSDKQRQRWQEKLEPLAYKYKGKYYEKIVQQLK